jgi:DNA-binding response OmpR family regulator
VEPDEETRGATRRQLEKERCIVIEARDAEEAEKAMDNMRPAAIVMDIDLPEGDGFDLLADLRKRDPRRKVPILVTTAKELSEDDEARLMGHVTHVLKKGEFEASELLARVRAALDENKGATADQPDMMVT